VGVFRGPEPKHRGRRIVAVAVAGLSVELCTAWYFMELLHSAPTPRSLDHAVVAGIFLVATPIASLFLWWLVNPSEVGRSENHSANAGLPLTFHPNFGGGHRLTMMDDGYHYEFSDIVPTSVSNVSYADIREVQVLPKWVWMGRECELRVSGVGTVSQPSRLNFSVFTPRDASLILKIIREHAPQASFNELAQSIANQVP